MMKLSRKSEKAAGLESASVLFEYESEENGYVGAEWFAASRGGSLWLGFIKVWNAENGKSKEISVNSRPYESEASLNYLNEMVAAYAA